MRVLARIATAAVFCCLAAGAQAATVKGQLIGCQNQGDLEKLYLNLVKQNHEGFVAQTREKLASGKCVGFQKGDKINILKEAKPGDPTLAKLPYKLLQVKKGGETVWVYDLEAVTR